MATKLRLEIHRITLQKRETGKRGTEYKNCNFSELLGQFYSDKSQAFPMLWTKFVEYFQDQFKTNTEGDKAITVTDICKHSFSPSKNVVNGEVNGGTTNREQSIYKRKNSKTSTGMVADDDVVASNFYVKLWLPYDYTTGVLMIHSYSNSNISELVKLHFTRFVQQYGFRLVPTSYYPKKFMEERNKHSQVVSVTYVKDKLSKDSRKLINPLFADFENLRVKIVVTGFRKPVSDFWQGFSNNGRALNTDIDALEFKADEHNTVMAKYEDEDGHSTTMNIDQKRMRDFAYYALPEEVMLGEKNTYDFDKIVKHTDSILETIKEEVGYIKSKKS